MQSSFAWRVIVGLSTIIISVAALAFPDYRVSLFVGLLILLVGAVMLWQFLQNRELRADVDKLKAAPPSVAQPTQPVADGRMWQEVEKIELMLEERWWKSANVHHYPASSTIRVTASGTRRFIIHLATDIVEHPIQRKRKFRSVKASAESKSLTRMFEIEQEGDYAIVVEPVVRSTFYVTVTTELEYVPGGINTNW